MTVLGRLRRNLSLGHWIQLRRSKWLSQSFHAIVTRKIGTKNEQVRTQTYAGIDHGIIKPHGDYSKNSHTPVAR